MREVSATSPWWRDYAIIAAVVAVVQAFQLTVLRHDVSVTGPIIDAFDFHREALRIAASVPPPQYPNFHPPYFQWLLSLVYRVGGAHPENGLYLQALLVLVIACELYALARLWTERRIALGVGLAAAVYGPLLFLSGQLSSAPLDAATALGALLLATRINGAATLQKQAVIGLIGGLAIASRGTVAPFVLLLIVRPWWSSLPTRDRQQRIGAVAAGVFLGLLPVALSNWQRSGHLTFTTMNAGINLWLGNNADMRATTALRPGHRWDYIWAEPARNGALTLLDQTAYFRTKAIEWLTHHPLDALLGLLIKLADTLNGQEVPRNLDPYGPLAHTPLTNLMLWKLPVLRFPFGFVLPFGLLGLARRWNTREARLLAAFVMLNALGIALFLPSGRYRLAIALALLVPAAEGVVALVAWARTNAPPASSSILIAVAIVALAINVMPQLTGPQLASELPMQRAEAARSSERWDDAERELLAIIHEHPDDADAWLLLGEVRSGKGNVQSSVEALEKVTQLAPESANAWQRLATIHLAQGRQKDAIQELEEALRSDPAQMFASAQLAEAAFETGDIQRAVSAGRIAVQVNPDNARGWLSYGAALRDSGDPTASEPVLRHALAMQPRRGVAHYQLALTLMEMARNEEAIKEARETLRLSPQHHGARQILSQLGAQ